MFSNLHIASYCQFLAADGKQFHSNQKWASRKIIQLEKLKCVTRYFYCLSWYFNDPLLKTLGYIVFKGTAIKNRNKLGAKHKSAYTAIRSGNKEISRCTHVYRKALVLRVRVSGRITTPTSLLIITVEKLHFHWKNLSHWLSTLEIYFVTFIFVFYQTGHFWHLYNFDNFIIFVSWIQWCFANFR